METTLFALILMGIMGSTYAHTNEVIVTPIPSSQVIGTPLPSLQKETEDAEMHPVPISDMRAEMQPHSVEVSEKPLPR